MLKKLASPKKRAPNVEANSFDAPGEVKSPSKKEKEQEKIKLKELEKARLKEAERVKTLEKEKLKAEKAKEKAKKKSAKKGAEAFSVGDATPMEVLNDEDKGAKPEVANEQKTPSPRKSLGRGFRRKTENREEKAPKESPTKKLSSPKKSLMKLPKPERKSKLVTKKQAAKPDEENTNAQPAPAETDPLTPTKPEAPSESPTRRKTRWKMSVPDIKHHKTSKAPNNQKELANDEKKDQEFDKTSPRSLIDNNASPDNSPRGREQRNKPKSKRELPIAESSSDESEGANQTNVLSPLRRHKPDPDDTLPIPESPHKAYLMHKRLAQVDVPPVFQPEVHLIGEIVSGQGFGVGFGFCCNWRVEHGSRWTLIAGDRAGQTQVDFPPSAPWGSSDVAVWSHPIDLHFATTAFQGWPKLLFQVHRVDGGGKHHTVGYGFVPVPFAAGQHELSVALWRPLGTLKEELDALVLGRMPELTNDDVLFNGAWAERCRLRTVSTGTVLVHVGVMCRHFQPADIVERC